MSEKKNQKTKAIELTEQDLDAAHGGASRKSSDLAAGSDERQRVGKGSDGNGTPVFNLPEDFAP